MTVFYWIDFLLNGYKMHCNIDANINEQRSMNS